MEKSWVVEVLKKHLKILGLSEKDTRWKIAEELLELCTKERIDLRNPKNPKHLIAEYDYISWADSKFKKPLRDFSMKNSKKYQFTIDNSRKKRIKSLEAELGGIEDEGFYYRALDAFSPRSKLLFDIVD